MKLFAALLCALLPGQALAADLASSVASLRAAKAVPVVPALHALGVTAAAAAADLGQAPLPQRLEAIGEQVSQDAAGLSAAATEDVAGIGGEHLRLLQGGKPEPADAAGGAVVAEKPSRGAAPLPPADPRRRSAVRRMMAGSMAFKLGMEAMTTAVPFVAMASLGGATAVALLVVGVYGTAQAVAGAFAGALAEKLPARVVLSAGMGLQAVVVAATLGLGFSGLLTPWVLFPLYAAAGAAIGAAETTRRLVPALLLGQDEEALRRYNATLHRYYEIAGVAGSALTGLVIWKFGALTALAVTPGAALVAAALFWTVRHPMPTAQEPRPGSDEARFGLGAALRLIWSDPRLRIASFAMLLPQIIHRVFENLLLPVYAKGVLGQEALSAALLTASNLGELVGASILLRYAARFTGPYRWVRWGAYGVVGAWALTLAPALGLSGAPALALLLPLILLFSGSWAASHLSLESEIQQKVPPARQPRVFGVLFGSYVVGAAAISIGIGRLLDGFGVGPALVAVNAAFTLVALAIWARSKKLKS